MVRMRSGDVDDVDVVVGNEIGVRAIGFARFRLLWGDEVYDEFLSRSDGGAAGDGSDDVDDVVDASCGWGDEEVFNESTGYTTGGCRCVSVDITAKIEKGYP